MHKQGTRMGSRWFIHKNRNRWKRCSHYVTEWLLQVLFLACRKLSANNTGIEKLMIQPSFCKNTLDASLTKIESTRRLFVFSHSRQARIHIQLVISVFANYILIYWFRLTNRQVELRVCSPIRCRKSILGVPFRIPLFEFVEDVIEAVRYLQEIARVPTTKELPLGKGFTPRHLKMNKQLKIIEQIRKVMFRPEAAKRQTIMR